MRLLNAISRQKESWRTTARIVRAGADRKNRGLKWREFPERDMVYMWREVLIFIC